MSKKAVKGQTLPKGWREDSLDNICNIITSPVDKKSVVGEIPVNLCNYTDVYYKNSINSAIEFMHATATPQEIKKFSLMKNDVVITKDSETSDDIGVPAYVEETIQNLLCGYHLAILRPKKDVMGKYIFYSLLSPKIRNAFYKFANGITRFGLANASYKKINILVPPLPEQKAIADTLQTWDTAIEKTEKLITAKEKRFEWLRQLLTKPNDKWTEAKIADVFILGRGRVISKKYLEENKGDYPVFSSQTSNNGELGRINTYDFKGEYLTWTTDGANAGAIFSRTGKFNCTNVCGIAKPKNSKDISVTFMSYFLKEKTKKYVSYVGNPKLMNGVFGEIPVVYPDIQEQKRIAKTLNTARHEIDLFKELAVQYRTQKRGLMQKLLTGKWRIRHSCEGHPSAQSANSRHSCESRNRNRNRNP